MTDFNSMRLNMVNNQIKPFAVTNPLILNAFATIPRENFGQFIIESAIYTDNILYLNQKKKFDSRYYLPAAIFAKMIQIADIRKHESVLDIGCLTGYSSAILSKICKTVDGLEQHEELVDIAKENIKNLGIENVRVHHGNLKDGYKKKELFDAVFINGSIDLIPQSINDQVKDGGRVIAIKRVGQIGFMVILKKAGNYMNQINHFEITVPYISKDFMHKSEFAF
jgi:protein-L-isoaspartate(D-aspartate) O-methyltransferase